MGNQKSSDHSISSESAQRGTSFCWETKKLWAAFRICMD